MGLNWLKEPLLHFLLIGAALFAIYYRGGQQADTIVYACIVSGLAVLGAALAALVSSANRRHWIGV